MYIANKLIAFLSEDVGNNRRDPPPKKKGGKKIYLFMPHQMDPSGGTGPRRVRNSSVRWNVTEESFGHGSTKMVNKI